ncbi:MAG: Hint domain-containing protein [Litoreibacter sp.]|nr:Hint domain-containing protein [Litoreibacter sp.]
MADIDGSEGNDSLSGTETADTITGNGGDDAISAAGGNDLVYGDYGPDGAPGRSASPLSLRASEARNETADGRQVDYYEAAELEDGTPIFVRVSILSKSNEALSVDLTGGGGREILLNGNFNAAMRGETVDIRLAFFNQETGEPLALNTVATFGDLDLVPGGQEAVSIDKNFLSSFATTADSTLTISEEADAVTASGGVNGDPEDQDNWFSVQLSNQNFIDITLTSRADWSGYTLNGDLIDDPVIVPTSPGNDFIDGGAGNDRLFGEEGDDFIDGGTGRDRIDGGTGDDTLFGGAGNDRLLGREGDDLLVGGAGRDRMFGGDGRDTFVQEGAADSNRDLVDGGSGGDDFDTLLLQGLGPFRLVDLRDDADGNSQSGRVELLGQEGEVVGGFEFREIERIVPCFTSGTLIATPQGERPIDALREGDRVITRDNGIQEIRWIGQKRLADTRSLPHLRPVCIAAGALGKGLPERDMQLSPNHRVFLMDDQVQLHFDEPEVLSAAKHLLGREGITRGRAGAVTYWHLLFDRHEVILSDGAWTESFQPGDYTLKGMDAAQRAELFNLFPQLASRSGIGGFEAARMTLKRYEAEMLRG